MFSTDIFSRSPNERTLRASTACIKAHTRPATFLPRQPREQAGRGSQTWRLRGQDQLTGGSKTGLGITGSDDSSVSQICNCLTGDSVCTHTHIHTHTASPCMLILTTLQGILAWPFLSQSRLYSLKMVSLHWFPDLLGVDQLFRNHGTGFQRLVAETRLSVHQNCTPPTLARRDSNLVWDAPQKSARLIYSPGSTAGFQTGLGYQHGIRAHIVTQFTWLAHLSKKASRHVFLKRQVTPTNSVGTECVFTTAKDPVRGQEAVDAKIRAEIDRNLSCCGSGEPPPYADALPVNAGRIRFPLLVQRTPTNPVA